MRDFMEETNGGFYFAMWIFIAFLSKVYN
jgi:hypothetical protein